MIKDKLNILHFSKTPLAGAPIRIVRALQQHTHFNVRLVDLTRWGMFEHDVVHTENPDEVMALAEKADIIHLHNYLDFHSQEFSPVDFNSLQRQGKFFLRHFHSTSMLVATEMGISVSNLLASPIPSIVIAQYPERFFPKSHVVPNIIPQNDSTYKPAQNRAKYGIVYSPTSVRSAWDDRWNTKGMPETVAIMKRVARRTGCKIKYANTRQPLAQVMQDKRQAAIIIDELVTGSYHLSGLEGLSLGKPVLAFLDHRIEQVLQEISGSKHCPFINVRLEDAFEPLLYLLEHSDEAKAIGQAGREWIESYWADHKLIQHFVDVYDTLVDDPGRVVRQERLRFDNSTAYFQDVTLPDLVYTARANHYKATLPLTAKIRGYAARWTGRLRQKFIKSLLHIWIKMLVNLRRSITNKLRKVA